MSKPVISLVVLAAVLTHGLPAQGRRSTGTPKDAPWLHIGLDRDIEWKRDPEVFIDARRPKRGLTEKVDRNAMMDAAIARAKREGKAVMWYVYRIVENTSRGRQMYRAPILDTYMQQVVFADPDVVRMVNASFVPLRMVCDEAMSKRFDMRPLDVIEPVVVFIDENGAVIHRIERLRTFSGHWFADLLRRVLNKAKLSVTVEDEVAAGGWEAALAALQSKSELAPVDRYRIAAMQRRLRRPADAMKTLAEITTDDAMLDSQVQAERGLILTMQRETEQAIAVLEKAFAADGPRAAEAGYLLAWNTLQLGREAEAHKLYQQVAERAPDSLWGRRARANTMIGNDERPVGAAFAGFEHFGYLADAAYEGLPEDTTWPGPNRKPEAIARAGVDYLLSQQRDHGGFTDCRYAYWGTPRITPNAWVAITALAGAALLEFRELDPQRIDAAIARAESYMFDPARLNRGDNEDVYADAYRLVYLARKHGTASGNDRADIVARMNGVITAAQRRQKKGGFWAHEYPNAFCTAAMVWGLVLAKTAGADVPDEVMDNAGTALLSARYDNGAFSYGGSAGSRGRQGSLKDSSGRMPVCEGALLALNRSDLQKLGLAFKTYWEFSDRLEGVRRNDFHSDGELAGFFYFHDLFHASEVSKLLPEEQQEVNRRALLEILQRIPEMDGSFVDSHEIGRSYGTAMALLTLKNVADF